MQGKRNTPEAILEKLAYCEHGITCQTCCWLWQYSVGSKGYPNIVYHKQHVTGHRLIWFFVKGQWPIGLLLHTCDNKRCMNWHHHYEGDHQQNMRDMKDRGRYKPVRGTRQSQAKLNEGKVRQARRLYHSGGWSQTALAEVFSVGQSVMNRIIHCEDWKHLQGEVQHTASSSLS